MADVNTELEICVEQLLDFGRRHKLVRGLDVVVARNALFDLLDLPNPCEKEYVSDEGSILDDGTPSTILDHMLDLAAVKGLYDNNTIQIRQNFETRLMGALMPREEEVVKKFKKLLKKKGSEAATDWFYNLCIVSNSIRTAEIARNIQWTVSTQYGTLEITINMTKPEKDPKTIAMERLHPKSGYPACMLCKENIGYAGRIDFPARQTLRIVPVKLAGDQFYLQYSPYAYFHEHCIVLHEDHIPMEMTSHTLDQLFDFVRQFPHYTCGSNAELPIVGGSILSHSHFQAGRYIFPMQRANISVALKNPERKGVKAGILNWPVSVLRLSGEDSDAVCSAGAKILSAWRQYSDENVEILAVDADGTPHNTVTPIVRYDPEEGYVLDLALRNNRTDNRYPDGIFHPHKQWHNIKKENIGLIEVMGMAILPTRLKRQMLAITGILTGQEDDSYHCEDSDLFVHAHWIDKLRSIYGTELSEETAQAVLQREVGIVFQHVLEDVGVFKQTPKGNAAFLRFVASEGYYPDS